MRRRDENVWEINFCFRHGLRTAFDRTCEAWRGTSPTHDCDVAPATVTRNTPIPVTLDDVAGVNITTDA